MENNSVSEIMISPICARCQTSMCIKEKKKDFFLNSGNGFDNE